MPKEGSQCIYLSVVLVDFGFRKGKNYYSQVFLDECKYIAKIKKDVWVYYWNIEISSYGSDEEISDEENSNEEN